MEQCSISRSYDFAEVEINGKPFGGVLWKPPFTSMLRLACRAAMKLREGNESLAEPHDHDQRRVLKPTRGLTRAIQGDRFTAA